MKEVNQQSPKNVFPTNAYNVSHIRLQTLKPYPFLQKNHIVNNFLYITGEHLKNYEQPFKTQGNQLVNPNQSPRFYAIADWTLENATIAGNITTAVHVDKQKADCFTMTSGWDGFGDLKNHKVYQTMTLPVGIYTFTAEYAEKNNAGKCVESYLVAAKGKGLPDTEQVNQALGTTRMQPKTKVNLSNQVQFILEEETEVSLGLVINMSGQLCATISRFRLYRNEAEFLEVQSENGDELHLDAYGKTTLFLPYAATLPEGITAYSVTNIQEGTAYIAPIAGNIVPAKTAVLLMGQPGTYRLQPGTTTKQVNSLLTGVLTDSPTDPNKRYYQLAGNVFQLVTDDTLQANHAYLATTADDTNATYKIAQVPTGIGAVENESSTSVIYDLSGRRVHQPTRGLYISKGKKIYR